MHLACDGKGRPLSVVVTPGHRHESTQLEAVLDAIWVARLGVGRPRKRPERLIADKGYSSPSCRKVLRKLGITHTSVAISRGNGASRTRFPSGATNEISARGTRVASGASMRTSTGDAT